MDEKDSQVTQAAHGESATTSQPDSATVESVPIPELEKRVVDALRTADPEIR
jgi:hypothetical protein